MDKLFYNMIKYHPTFVGWLIYNHLVKKEEDELVIREDNTITDYLLENPLKEYDFPYDELTHEFTIENIKKKQLEWSEIIKTEYSDTYRSGKDYHVCYSYVNQWKIFMNKREIPLTYELAKCLSEIEIKVGGYREQSTGGYIEFDEKYYYFNGLFAFLDHRFASIKELERCIDDSHILNIILGQDKKVNIDIVKYITDKFFHIYTLIEYLEIVNNLKDWYDINQFDRFRDIYLINTIPKPKH